MDGLFAWEIFHGIYLRFVADSSSMTNYLNIAEGI